MEQLQRSRLVEARPNRLDLVHLPDDRGLVGVRGNQPRQLVFLLIQLRLLGAERSDRRLKEVFDSGGLFSGQREIALELRIAPPRETERLSLNGRRERQQSDRRQK